MVDAICETLGVEPVDRFQSVHNYVDFRDLTVRKGATPAREGQRLVVPFNMAEGSVLARGKGNERFHRTAPHGAGRVMSRREALDEAPMAYKPASAVAEAIEPTAETVDWLDAVHNLKARA